MAGIKKRGKIYYIKFHRTVDGLSEEIVRSLKTRNKELAERRKDLLEEREKEGQDPFSDHFNWSLEFEQTAWTVRECYDDFLKAKDKYRPATIRGYKYVIDKFMRHQGCKFLLLNELSKDHFERFLMRDGIKAVTRHSEKRRLHSFWTWCMDQKRIKVDLIKGIDLPQKNVEYRSKMISEDEFKEVMKAYHARQSELRSKPYFREWMGQYWFEAAMMLFFYTGLRRAEVGHDHKDDKSGLRGVNIIGVPGEKIDYIYIDEAKVNRERFIPVIKKLEAALLNYFEFRGWPGENDYVFMNGKGQPVTGRAMYYAFKDYCDKAGVSSNRTIHGMRHRRGTEWLEKGFTLREVKDMLGHASVQTTDQLYTHLTPRKLKEKMDRLEREG